MEFNKYIDHTNLKPEAQQGAIDQLCAEARDYQFFSVCVNGYWTHHCQQLLAGSAVKITNVIGFPLGAMSTASKAAETRQCIADGADEIDMVINIGALKDGRLDVVEADIRAVKEAAGPTHVVKCIFETCLLTKDEIATAVELAIKAGADFVKTSTGFNKGGATVEDVTLMATTARGRIAVKASGGVRTQADAAAMIAAGATRLGTSNGVTIVTNQGTGNSY